MSSIDDLFKKPASTGNKRPLETSLNAGKPNKHRRLQPNESRHSNGNSAVTTPDEDEDTTAGPEPPLVEGEIAAPDDEEGRFFGGGITNGTAEILDYIDKQDGDGVEPEKIDSAWVRKLALNFERRVTKNAELRARFEDDPKKFMGSEADLDSELKTLSSLSEHPELYEEFTKLGCVSSLVSLLAHENTDVAIDAIEIISELTDEDVDAEQSQWDVLVDAMLEADILSLLTQNLDRLDEDNESDRGGVYHTLNVLENLASQIRIAELIGLETTIMTWIMNRLKRKEQSTSQNKQYAAEVLAILLQSSSANRSHLTKLDGVDILLQLLSTYRKRDPVKGTDEEEYVENVFDCLTCLVEATEGKSKFVEAEGVELCMIMLREGNMSRPRALRLLDHSVGGKDGGEICEKVVDTAGLKTIFTMFMKKQDHPIVEHLIGIMAALLRHLPATSEQRIRTMAKFVEKDYEKITRLVKLRREYAARAHLIDDEIKLDQASLSAEHVTARADEWFSRRMDAGLFCLQTIDVVLAWLVAEDDGAKDRIQSLLAERDEGLALIQASLEDQLSTMDELDGEDYSREMLVALLQFL